MKWNSYSCMSRSGCAVLPQFFAEYMAFGIYYIQNEVEDRTSDLLSTKKERVISQFCTEWGKKESKGELEKQNTQVRHTKILRTEQCVGQILNGGKSGVSGPVRMGLVIPERTNSLLESVYPSDSHTNQNPRTRTKCGDVFIVNCIFMIRFERRVILPSLRIRQ